MQRYNPPTTSAQTYCHGCQRQIRKVQEMMDDKYLTNIEYQVDKNSMQRQIEALQRQLELERLQACTMRAMLKRITPDEKVQELVEINKKLTESLQKEVKNLEEYPLEEWYNAIQQKWTEKYQNCHDYAMEKKEEMLIYKEDAEKTHEDAQWYRRELAKANKMLMKNEQEIAALKRGADKENVKNGAVEKKDDVKEASARSMQIAQGSKRSSDV
ncbi:hypothetical protein CRE_08150 [Caenorhabditis remanei]|uniref:Uncharacterized protein n=1 Tax=Caenorhabditis remanei TaxID=31234 RepID=E3M3P5_CAERE|nr:hypothetical protein CRE_08150 [Caenorhabditis remanei]